MSELRGVDQVPAGIGVMDNLTLNGIINLISSNPKIMLSVLVQFAMGLGLGYYMARVIKYVIALILVLIAGAILNVWSMGGSLEKVISSYGESLFKYKDVILSLIKSVGILTVGPITAGFFVGLIVGWAKK